MLMASWNGFNFEVSPYVVRGFEGLTIKGGTETEDKVAEEQKYVERKNSTTTEISLSIYLNTYLGCSVREEANRFIRSAMDGDANYFYVGNQKLVTYKLMLTQAEVTEVEIAPEGTWVSCKIKLTMKQCEKYKTKSSSSGSSGSGKKTVTGSGGETVGISHPGTTKNGVLDFFLGSVERRIAEINKNNAAAAEASKTMKMPGGSNNNLVMTAK